MDVFERIKNKRNSLSKSFIKVADFICSHYEDVVFMSVAEVAEKVGVNKSVVVRFAGKLGYTGFLELRKKIEGHVRDNLRLPNRMLSKSLSVDSSCQDIMTIVLNTDVNNIMSTLKDPYNKKLDATIEKIKNADRVYLIGNRGLYRVALLMQFLLDLAGIDAIALNAADNADYQRIVKIDNKCLLLAYSFPRYNQRIQEAIKHAKKKKATTIVLSDSPFSIDAKIADYSINIKVESNTFINSYAAIISVMNAIVTAIGIKYPKDTMRSLDDIENCLQYSELGEYQLNTSETKS